MVRVELLVYDLSRGMAASMSQAILGQRIDGIWHTGVVVFTQEYYFGGGIQTSPRGSFSMGSGLPVTQTIDMGETNKSQSELQAFLSTIRGRFTQQNYDLIRNNCNHFSNEVCVFLTGRSIPSFIIDLPNIVFATPGGAMLRPLIENMQSSIQQQQSTMDPFGGMGAASSTSFANSSGRTLSESTSSSTSTGYYSGRDVYNTRPAAAPTPAQTSGSFEASLSSQITSTLQKPVSVPPKKVELEDFPLTSSDGSTAAIIGKKILSLAGPDGVPGSALSAEEKATVESIIAVLSKNADKSTVDAKSLDTFKDIMVKHPSLQMSCLFFLRLMALHDHVMFHDSVTVEYVLDRLSEGPQAFSSVSAMVMALCFVANLLSHEPGVEVLFAPKKRNSSNENGDDEVIVDRSGQILDIALATLNHERSEVRQMGSALAYNFTLCCSNNNKTDGSSESPVWQWKGSSSGKENSTTTTTSMSTEECNPEDLHPHAVQLLCGTLESLHTETDVTARKRKLATACRVIRQFGMSAGSLARDLGFNEVIALLHSQLESKANNEYEMGILHELSVAMSSEQ